MITSIWLVCLAAYAVLNSGMAKALKPSELGDALAGVSPPLTFLWLVLGLLQQAYELRQNSRALRMWAEKLGS